MTTRNLSAKADHSVSDGNIGSFLQRYWSAICALAISIFIVYQAFIQVDHLRSENPICTRNNYAEWSWNLNLTIAGSKFVTIFLVLLRIHRIQLVDKSSRAASTVTIACMIMSLCTSCISLVDDWGGICVDALGVATPAVVWGEWLVCGPLLILVALSLDNRSSLTKRELVVICSVFLTIFFGFIIIFHQPVWLAVIWLSLSCIFYCAVYIALYDAYQDLINIRKQSYYSDSNSYRKLLELSKKKVNLLRVFSFLMLLYPLVYFLALAQMIDKDIIRVCLMFADLISKGSYAVLITDNYTELLHPAEMTILRNIRDNEARREFLKYIFHEVRVPLNSLTMGIQYLREGGVYSEEEKESLLLMHDACTCMGVTLNEVLNLQRIEENKLKLEFAPFSFRQSVYTVTTSLQASIERHAARVEMSIASDIPDQVVGDHSRVEQILFNFLSNAIKFSLYASLVLIKVTWKSVLRAKGRKCAEITCSVHDESPGISVTDQQDIFTAEFYNYTNVASSHATRLRGISVGLSISKHLATLHGGSVKCESSGAIGNTFSFIIPFPVMTESIRSKHLQDQVAVEISQSDNMCMIMGQQSDNNCSYGVSRGSCSRNSLSFGSFRPFSWSTRVSDRETEEAVSLGKHLDTVTNDVETGAKKEYSDVLQRSPNNSNSATSSFELGMVLVVDDVASNRKMLCQLLSKRGVKTEMAENGQEALSLVQRSLDYYSLIFMDNMMPIMNGVEATKILREKGYCGMIIGVTGCAMNDDIAQYDIAGADLVLTKPLKSTALDSILRLVRERGSKSLSDRQLKFRGETLHWVMRK